LDQKAIFVVWKYLIDFGVLPAILNASQSSAMVGNEAVSQMHSLMQSQGQRREEMFYFWPNRHKKNGP
jgi:hypothetical protein